MNNSATVNTPASFLDLFNFNLTAAQPKQDAELIKQLPFVPGLK